MTEYIITSPEGKKYKVTGEGTKEEALQAFQQQYQAPEQEAGSKPIYSPPKISPGGVSTDPGIREPLLANLTGMAADAVGGIAGIGQIPLYASGLSDVPPENVVKGWQEKLTYQPKDPRAIQNMQGTAQLMDPLVSAIDKTRTGEKTMRGGGGPGLATANEMFPDIVGAMLGLKGIQKPPQFSQAPGATYSSPIPMRMDGQTGNLASAMSRRSGALSDIRTGKPTARSAKFTLPGVNAATVEKLAKKAVGQGWDNSFVAWVKGANKPTRQNLKEMVNITKRRVGEMKDFSYNGRPSDVLGKSLKLRLDRVKQVQRQSGKMITKVAKKQLQGKTVDMTAPMESFRGKIMELGGRMNDKGDLVFGVDSRLFGQASKAGALKKVYQKIESLGDVTDAYKAHELKLFIDELVDYGKSSKTGLSANVESLLKGFRAEINTTLQGMLPAYDKVNTSYSMTTQALGDFQKAAGSSIDLFGPQADAATGRVLRKLLSNMQNRENLSAAMKQVEDVATQFGGKYADDLTAQAKAVNEIERLFGSFAETSFKGEITASGQRIAESPSLRQAGTEAVRLSAKQLRKMRQNETTQIRALEELIYQGGN